MKKITGFSTFTRLAITYLCTLLIIYCVMAWLLIQNTAATRDEFLDSRRLQAQSYIEDLERQFSGIYAQESYLVNNQDVRKLAYSLYSNNYEKYQLVLSLFHTLDYIKSLSPMIDRITIDFPPQAMSVSSDDGYSEDSIPRYIDQAPTGYLMEENGGLIMRISYPLMYSLSEEYTPDMIITFALSEQSIIESLEIFADDAGNGAALVYNGKLAIGDIDDDILSQYLTQSGEIVEGQALISNESFRTDVVSSALYPMELILCINNEALTRITVRNIILLTLVTLIASIIFIVFLSFSRRLIHKPLSEMVGAFEKLREGQFDVRIHHKSRDEFHFIYREFNDTVEKLQQLIAKVLEQDKLINAAELAQLQSQIDPHFLYNSFFIIDRMAKNEEHEQITTFVTSLARYYRFLNKAQQDAIPLKQEIEHMNNYIAIQQMRFGDKIRVEQVEALTGIEDCLVPKLVLQPLIENAYEYGMANKLEDGLIRISYTQSGGDIQIKVEDNGSCSEETIAVANARLSAVEDDQKSHALYNINRRLKLYYGNESGLSIEKSELGGFKVCLRLRTKPNGSRIDD